MVSFYFCDAAREAGAVVVAGVPVARIVPGEGVVLEGGEFIAAPVVISNADPRQTLRLLGTSADPAWRKRVEEIPMEGCTVKLNVLLRELPNFTARPGTDQPHHYGQINTPLTKAEWKAAFAAARRGELPEHLWCELYFQSAHDPTVAARRAAHHERLRAVRPVQICARHMGRAARGSPPTRAQFPGPLLLQYRQRRDRCAGARSSGYRAKGRAHRRPHFSG